MSKLSWRVCHAACLQLLLLHIRRKQQSTFLIRQLQPLHSIPCVLILQQHSWVLSNTLIARNQRNSDAKPCIYPNSSSRCQFRKSKYYCQGWISLQVWEDALLSINQVRLLALSHINKYLQYLSITIVHSIYVYCNDNPLAIIENKSSLAPVFS